jgi:serine/threonine protein phosphatase 1
MFFRKIRKKEQTPRRIIIGDVHGSFDALLRLLNLVAPDSQDEVYFLGDLIDRGPQSLQVVDFVIKNNYQCLLGNHEYMLVKALGGKEVSEKWLNGWIESGGAATLLSYNNNIPAEHIDWFQSLPNYLDLGDIWLVHAGVHPEYPLEKQTSEQFCWIRNEFHTVNQPYFKDKLIITGHTLTFTFPDVKPGQLARGSGWLDIETGVYHPQSGWLTALDWTNQLVYQVHTENKNCRTIPLEKAVVNVDVDKISRYFSQKKSSKSLNL